MELFANNLINWLLLLVFLGWLWAKFTPGMFASRKESIEASLREAASAKQEAQSFLRQQEQKIANAEKEADQILVDAKRVAEEMRVQMVADTKVEADNIRRKIEQQVASERQQAITEMRSQAATVAVRLAEATLPGAISDSARKRLLGEFIEQVETIGSKK
jgi:F-type H+-transporting ATPase subunit b